MAKERPMLFSAPMVQAILNGRKTQTRRAVKSPQLGPKASWQKWEGESWRAQGLTGDIPVPWRGKTLYCLYGVSGERLWVRESFQFVHANSDGQRNTFNSSVPFTQHDYRWIEYAATPKDREPPPKWKPSIFMPRWASRITLEITGVRLEKLNDISGDDCAAEGIEPQGIGSDMAMVVAYKTLWESINGKGSWAANPWVWCISFKRINP